MGLRLADVGAHTAVDGTLAGDDGATVRLAMDLAVEAAREAGDERGTAARQADVLVQWARDYLARAHGPGDSLADDAHTVRTHTHVVCTPEQLAAAGTPEAEPPTLTDLLEADLTGRPGPAPVAAGIAGDRGTLSRGALRRLACDGLIDLVAIDQGQRPDPLYVGRAARIVSRELWRALVVRDRRCVVAGCHRRPAQCEAHHVRHWADGGLTDLTNLVHQQAVHPQWGYRSVMVRDGGHDRLQRLLARRQEGSARSHVTRKQHLVSAGSGRGDASPARAQAI